MMRRRWQSAAATGGLLLGVEEDGGDWEAEAEIGGKVTSTEVGTGGRLLDQAEEGPLLEQHHYVAMDTHWWAWTHVRHYHLPCL